MNDKLLSDWNLAKIEYALPNSSVDMDELYHFACGFEKQLAETIRELAQVKSRCDFFVNQYEAMIEEEKRLTDENERLLAKTQRLEGAIAINELAYKERDDA